MDVKAIDEKMLSRIQGLGLPSLEEHNPFIVLSVRGDGTRASARWSAKVYKNRHGRLKLVTTDLLTLERLLSGEAGLPKCTIRVDDAGWGFPLGGVMIGAEKGGRIETGLVGVEFFQGALFEQRVYLSEAAHITRALVERFDGDPADTMVEICTGFVNSESKHLLRKEGFEVHVTEITGLLQHELEKRFKEYIESLGYREYFDPKEARDPAAGFRKVILWIDGNPAERMKIAKTGWKFFKNRAKA